MIALWILGGIVSLFVIVVVAFSLRTLLEPIPDSAPYPDPVEPSVAWDQMLGRTYREGQEALAIDSVNLHDVLTETLKKTAKKRGRPTVWTPRTQKKAVAMRRKGETQRSIASHFGVSPSTVNRLFVRLDMESVDRYVTGMDVQGTVSQ